MIRRWMRRAARASSSSWCSMCCRSGMFVNVSSARSRITASAACATGERITARTEATCIPTRSAIRSAVSPANAQRMMS
jgi:hypothetical protein